MRFCFYLELLAFKAGKRSMDDIKKIIPILAENNASVLLYGEKGTGKSYIASAVHQKKGGIPSDFFEVNCKSFSEEKNEGIVCELRKRLFNSGSTAYATFFLNCVNKMSENLQKKVLSLIDDGVNSKKNFKVISSTEENLEEKIHKGVFLDSLF